MRFILSAAVICVISLFSTGFLGAQEVPQAEKKPIIILKLDDVTALTPRWKKCAEFLAVENVKSSFGIIGYALEEPKPGLLDWIRQLHESGMVEFWNHGYKNRTGQDKQGEFEVESAEEQKQAIERTQALVKEKLGITMRVFGPHWSGTNKVTEEALTQIPDIVAVFYYTKPAQDRAWFVFRRHFVLEEPLFVPNLENIRKRWEAGAKNYEYLCLQGHPNQWDEKRFEAFARIIAFFKEQGCEFMTPSEYLAKIGKLDKGVE